MCQCFAETKKAVGRRADTTIADGDQEFAEVVGEGDAVGSFELSDRFE